MQENTERQEKAVDIFCFYERKVEGKLEIKYKEYVVPAGRAGEKIRELLEKVVSGEISSFSVSLSDRTLLEKT